MNIIFSVGNKEKHEIEFFFNEFWGNINFKVDGQIVKRFFIMFSASLTKSYRITIGEKEKHEVEVKFSKPRLFAAARKELWLFSVIVDGKIIKEVKYKND